LLELRDDTIAYANVSFDFNDLIPQLTRIDHPKLMACLDTVRRLGDELTDVRDNRERQRDLTEQLGRALDAARLVVRPHFRR
jgi:hypothetical protein